MANERNSIPFKCFGRYAECLGFTYCKGDLCPYEDECEAVAKDGGIERVKGDIVIKEEWE